MNIATKIQIIALALAKIQHSTFNKYATAAPYASIIEAGRSPHMTEEYP